MDDSYTAAGMRLFERLLARTHLSRPFDVATIVEEELTDVLDARDVVTYLIDLDATELVPLPPAGSAPQAQDIEGSMAGRSFTSTRILSTPGADPGRTRVFVPLVDGTDRLGVLHADLPVPGDGSPGHDLLVVLERFGHAVAQILIAKRMYGDALHDVQRARPLEVGAELLSAVLPPSTFASEGLVVSALVLPAYENGGDAFDYAVNERAVHLAVFDAIGHGLHAARLSTFAVSAYRASRRTGADLVETYESMDTHLGEQFGESFTTAVLAELDPVTGVLRWINAGHPPPLLLRDDRVVKVLQGDRATPLGMPMFATEPTVSTERLQPGDVVVLYTDGIVEARRPSGEQLGVEGLSEFLQRGAAARQSPPETLRRLRRALTADGDLQLRDDATVLVAHWHRNAEADLLPQTV